MVVKLIPNFVFVAARVFKLTTGMIGKSISQHWVFCIEFLLQWYLQLLEVAIFCIFVNNDYYKITENVFIEFFGLS